MMKNKFLKKSFSTTTKRSADPSTIVAAATTVATVPGLMGIMATLSAGSLGIITLSCFFVYFTGSVNSIDAGMQHDLSLLPIIDYRTVRQTMDNFYPQILQNPMPYQISEASIRLIQELHRGTQLLIQQFPNIYVPENIESAARLRNMLFILYHLNQEAIYSFSLLSESASISRAMTNADYTSIDENLLLLQEIKNTLFRLIQSVRE
jgi:hypothetical protein